MPRITSKKQIAANQRNSAKSTGPVTPKGKKRSRMNRLTHGLRARDVVLTSGRGAENPADFKKLLETLLADFRPSSALEQGLVEKLAACLWRSRRAHRFELNTLLNADLPDEREEEIRREISEKNGFLAANQESLRFLKNFAKAVPVKPDWADAALSAALRKVVIKAAQHMGLPWANVDPSELLTQVREQMNESTDEIRNSSRRLHHEISALEDELLSRDETAAFGVIPDPQSVATLMRYESANDRQLHRLIYQLLGKRKAPLHLVMRDLRDSAPSNEGRPPKAPKK